MVGPQPQHLLNVTEARSSVAFVEGLAPEAVSVSAGDRAAVPGRRRAAHRRASPGVAGRRATPAGPADRIGQVRRGGPTPRPVDRGGQQGVTDASETARALLARRDPSASWSSANRPWGTASSCRTCARSFRCIRPGHHLVRITFDRRSRLGRLLGMTRHYALWSSLQATHGLLRARVRPDVLVFSTQTPAQLALPLMRLVLIIISLDLTQRGFASMAAGTTRSPPARPASTGSSTRSTAPCSAPRRPCCRGRVGRALAG